MEGYWTKKSTKWELKINNTWLEKLNVLIFGSFLSLLINIWLIKLNMLSSTNNWNAFSPISYLTKLYFLAHEYWLNIIKLIYFILASIPCFACTKLRIYYAILYKNKPMLFFNFALALHLKIISLTNIKQTLKEMTC